MKLFCTERSGPSINHLVRLPPHVLSPCHSSFPHSSSLRHLFLLFSAFCRQGNAVPLVFLHFCACSQMNADAAGQAELWVCVCLYLFPIMLVCSYTCRCECVRVFVHPCAVCVCVVLVDWVCWRRGLSRFKHLSLDQLCPACLTGLTWTIVWAQRDADISILMTHACKHGRPMWV